MNQKYLKIIQDNKGIIFLFLVSIIIPAIWLSSGNAIETGESGFTFLMIPQLAKQSLFTWFNSNFGYSNVRVASTIPYYLALDIIHSIGFNMVSIQYLVFTIIIFTSMLFIYLLIKKLFTHKNIELIALIGGLFYILNPYTMIFIFHRFVTSIFVPPFLPLIFIAGLRILKKPSFSNAFLFAFIVVLASVIAVDPPYFIIIFTPFLIYAFIYFILNIKSDNIFKKFKFLLLGFLLAILFSSWWIIPLIKNAGVEISRIGAPSISLVSMNEISNEIPLLYIIRLLDINDVKWYGVNYNPGFIEFLIPLVSILPLLLKRDKKLLFFGFLLLIGLFLSKGIQPPFGGFFNLIFDKIPYFFIFRNPIEKIGIIISFSYAILFSFGVWSLFEIFKKHKIISYLIISTTLILVLYGSVWPMWTGQVFSISSIAVSSLPSPLQIVPSTQVSIPNYWFNAASYINKDERDCKIVFFPQSPSDGMWYNWTHGYGGSDTETVDLLFNKPIIESLANYNYTENYRKLSLENFCLSEPKLCDYFLAQSNVCYVLVRVDVNPNYIGSNFSIKNLEESINSIPSLNYQLTIGETIIYKVKDNSTFPAFYSAIDPILVNKSFDSIDQKFLENNTHMTLFFSDQINNFQMNLINESNYPDYKPIITFEELNPTKYMLQIQNASRPFFLVFPQSYDSGWKLYVNNETFNFNKIIADYKNTNVLEAESNENFNPLDIRYLFETSLNEKYHIMVDGYANSWFIDPGVIGSENFTITIYYDTQSYLYLGLIISIFSFICCLFLLLKTHYHID